MLTGLTKYSMLLAGFRRASEHSLPGGSRVVINLLGILIVAA